MRSLVKYKIVGVLVIAILLMMSFGGLDYDGKPSFAATKAKKPTYTITPNSKPYNGKYLKSKKYNKYTKHYYLLRSYLDQLEEVGGGTLVLKDGTYTVSNLLYVGSNITIKLSSGTTIKKSYETGSGMAYSKALFHIIGRKPATSGKKITKYNGSHDVKIIGTGNATIDLDFCDDALGFMIGHGKNITFKGLNFKDMRSNHPIELDGTYNTLIENCTFSGYKEQTHSTAVKEGINIDAPDENNLCFQVKWSSFDKTPNKKIVIRGCEFHKLGTAIGTHRYSQIMNKDGVTVTNRYHNDITIENNSFYDIDSYTIRVQNWKNVKLLGNNFAGNDGEFCVYAQGMHNFKIKENVFHNYKGVLLARSSWQIAMTDWYQPIYNEITDDMLKMIANENYTFDNGPSDYYSGDKNVESGYVCDGKFTRETSEEADDGYGTFYFKKIVTTQLDSDNKWVSKITCTPSTREYTVDGVKYSVKHTYDSLLRTWTFVITNLSTGQETINKMPMYEETEAASSDASANAVSEAATTEAATTSATTEVATTAVTTEVATTTEASNGSLAGKKVEIEKV